MSALPLISVHRTRYMQSPVTTSSVSHAQWLEPPNGNWNVVGQINVTGSSRTLISSSVFSVNLYFH